MLNQQQLIWRCRRGVRELDVLLGRYLAPANGDLTGESLYSQLDQQGKAAFERLLETQDPVIMDWLFGKYTSEDEGIAEIISQLQNLSGL